MSTDASLIKSPELEPKLLFGRLETKSWRGSWLETGIRVFLRDI